MSTAAKATLLSTTLGAIGIIVFVHYTQRAEKAAMHDGVLRDLERQRLKRERQLDFDLQKQLEREYRQLQTVSGTEKDGNAAR
ncbi:putative cytochrome c oxidase assembly protein [Lineolata rhizophorae]|uniref:Putative cytochrome c oxidase assembly protein n=1 Tax=Lineolata rhizophorae TaxID=578093 RepID=A0A6A6NP29_9PEZI|nr:putative cytochrome c oxidase assembly protein [Lineolata rhizophorae]